jgi:hypothetical protein
VGRGVLVGKTVAVGVEIVGGLAVSVGFKASAVGTTSLCTEPEGRRVGVKVGVAVSLVVVTARPAREEVRVGRATSAEGVGLAGDATVDVGEMSAQPTNNTQVPSAINKTNSIDSLGH